MSIFERMKIWGGEKSEKEKEVEFNFVLNAPTPEERKEAFAKHSPEDQMAIIEKGKAEGFSQDVIAELEGLTQEAKEREAA